MVKEFEFFLKKGDVKKQSPDKNLSKATFKESLERLQLAELLWNKVKAKYVLENAYESMREVADAILYQDGYKSYSHEASIVYLLTKGFSDSEIAEIGRFRKIRNGIKYYGGDCGEEDANSALKLAKIIINKAKKFLD